MRGHDDLAVSCAPCPSMSDLEPIWRELEPRAAPIPFFQSWDWIGPWLSVIKTPLLLLQVTHGATVVGLGLLGAGSRPCLGMSVPQVFLNQSGVPAEDAVFIEFNDLLLDPAYEQSAFEALWRALRERAGSDVPAWQEWVLSGVTESVARRLNAAQLPHRVLQTRAAPYADLNASGNDGVLAKLSRNTRYQIKRSLKVYQERGDVTITPAHTYDEAQEWLAELARLHQRAWQARGEAGAFLNPMFQAFVDALLAQGFPRGRVEVLRASAGDNGFGYLLNLIEEDRALNYQTGFLFEDSPYVKPGLVSHTLAMQHYADRGKSVYHFLAGDSQYKSSLSQDADTLIWLTVTQPLLLLRAEQFLRGIKERFTSP